MERLNSRVRWLGVLVGLVLALAGGARVLAAGGSSVSGPLTFTWSMADRFGLDADHDGRIDEDNSTTYANPTSYRTTFDACASPAATSAGASASFRWTFTAANPTFSKVVTGTCKVDVDLPRLGAYTAQADIMESGSSVATTNQSVTLKDYLVVSVGDSVAS